LLSRWKLAIQIVIPDTAGFQRKFDTDNLSLFAAHSVGTGHPLPLSDDDNTTPLQVIKTVLELLTAR
jgi:hypothetical protein